MRAPRKDTSSFSLLRPTGFSAADCAICDTHSVHHTSLRTVNCWSDPSLIPVKSRSVHNVQEPMSRSEQAVRSRRNRKMTSAILVGSALDFWRYSGGPSGSLVPISTFYRRLHAASPLSQHPVKGDLQTTQFCAYHIHEICCPRQARGDVSAVEPCEVVWLRGRDGHRNAWHSR